MWTLSPSFSLAAIDAPAVSLAPIPLQGGPFSSTLVLLVATFVGAWVFYAVTLHLAATFFIGEVRSQRAAYAGAVPAVVSLLLQRYGVASVGFVSPELGVGIVVVATVLADAVAISTVYDLPRPATAALTLLHVAFATVLGIALANLFGMV
ncbi:hypothetical protein [Halorhabdus sp. BNX81]|uniref:DUF7473 family protein n=1 Tax=Halorhabdus sp. BNX81 TaxID=2980181 RepID=UPI0023DD5AA6|nr:hypothetical protein [Halorhabdus sp. BNX81]WEL20434.1 putative membrane protein [Halorhabdus sp. BNX81]